MLVHKTRVGYNVIFMLVIALFVLLSSSTDFGITGFAVFSPKHSQQVQLGDILYDVENGVYFYTYKYDSGKYFLARYYPETYLWRETQMYVEPDNPRYMHSLDNPSFESYAIRRTAAELPEASHQAGVITILSADGEKKKTKIFK